MRMVFDDNDRLIPDEMRDYALKKLGRVENWPDQCTELGVVMTVEGNAPLYRTELTWQINSNVFRVEVAAAEMYTSIDLAADQVRIQLRKWSFKSRNRLHDSAVDRIKPYMIEEATSAESSFKH